MEKRFILFITILVIVTFGCKKEYVEPVKNEDCKGCVTTIMEKPTDFEHDFGYVEQDTFANDTIKLHWDYMKLKDNQSKDDIASIQFTPINYDGIIVSPNGEITVTELHPSGADKDYLYYSYHTLFRIEVISTSGDKKNWNTFVNIDYKKDMNSSYEHLICEK